MSEENKDSRKQKRDELIVKTADTLAKGAKKLDEAVDKRSVLGDLSAPIMLGVLAMLVVALINYPNLLVIGLLGVAAGSAPKIVKKIMELKAKKKEEPAVKPAKKEKEEKKEE